MEPEAIYENINEHKISIKSTARILQTEAKTQTLSGCRCLLLSTVCLGLICASLVAVIIVLYISNTAQRDKLTLSYMDEVTNYNQTINILTFEKDMLLETVKSCNQKKLESDIRIKNVTAEKDQLQQNLQKTKLELETKIKNFSERGWYFISNNSKSWSNSRQYCRDRGGDLVIINSEEEQKFISSLQQSVWIGLSDIEKEGTMKWVDNSSLTKGFWMGNEPNDTNKDCVEIDPTLPVLNNWNDLLCSDLRKWICEI